MMIDMKETIGFAQPYLQKMNVDQKVIARHFGSSYRMVSISVQGSMPLPVVFTVFPFGCNL